jgi:small-conductance mechanosensitive channel
MIGLSQTYDRLVELASQHLSNLLTSWTAYQAIVILICLLFAHIGDRLVAPRLEAQLRRLKRQPMLMRILVVPLRRIRWLLWALLLFASALTLREMTWPSRSFFVMLAAQLVGAWVAISIASRLVRNRELSFTVAIVGWCLAALAIVGLFEPFAKGLDAVGLVVGERRISLLNVVKGLAVFAFLIWLSTVLGSFVEQRLARASDLTPTFQVLIAKFAKAFLIVVAITMTLTAVGIDLTALAVFSGALGLGIGFGLQKVTSNLISGVIILVDRSIKPGDVISLGETFGWISRLQSRYVSVVTRDGVEHLIPNETFISAPVINWSHTSRQIRLEVKFGTSYGDDPHATREMTVEAVAGLKRVLSNPAPVCHVVGFGNSSVDFVLRFWIEDPQNGITNISGLVYLAIWDVFKQRGVSIPYPHRELRMREPVQVVVDKPMPA